MSPVILIAHAASVQLLADIRELAPPARILGPEDIRRDPGLLGQVEVVYGHMDAAEFARAGRLRWLHTTAAGAGWVQDPAVQAHGAVVTNSRIHAAQISEHLFGLLLMLVHALDRALVWQQQRQWQRPDVARLRPLEGRRLCVLGLGVIGGRCARLGEALGMHVVGLRRRGGPIPHVAQVYGPEQLDECVAGADVVMNLLPGTAATHGRIGRRQFERMAAGAIFLNAGRGNTVRTDDLVEALRAGRLGGAGLDVTDPEPLPSDHPLWTLPNVLITAHYSGSVADYFQRTDRVFLDNLRRYLAGAPLVSVVDKQAGY